MKKIIDLGQCWCQETGLPAPWEGVAVKRSLTGDLQEHLNTLVKESLEFSIQYPEEGFKFVKQHAAKVKKDTLTRNLIHSRINNYSKDIKNQEIRAVKKLQEKAVEIGFCKESQTSFFYK